MYVRRKFKMYWEREIMLAKTNNSKHTKKSIVVEILLGTHSSVWSLCVQLMTHRFPHYPTTPATTILHPNSSHMVVKTMVVKTMVAKILVVMLSVVVMREWNFLIQTLMSTFNFLCKFGSVTKCNKPCKLNELQFFRWVLCTIVSLTRWASGAPPVLRYLTTYHTFFFSEFLCSVLIDIRIYQTV